MNEQRLFVALRFPGLSDLAPQTEDAWPESSGGQRDLCVVLGQHHSTATAGKWDGRSQNSDLCE